MCIVQCKWWQLLLKSGHNYNFYSLFMIQYQSVLVHVFTSMCAESENGSYLGLEVY